MGEGTKIEWATHTFNPVWGCTKIVGPAGAPSGCDHCYAATFAHRLGMDLWGKGADRRTFGDKHWNEPLRWDDKAAKAGERHRVFCASMADVFEDHPIVADARLRLWKLIEATTHLDWLLLTKRPENVLRFAPALWTLGHWPANAWLGTTVEDDRNARIRIPRLLAVPGVVPVRFLSVEPLLGEVDLWPWLERIDWVIAGGESGAGARPMDVRWVRRVRDECAAAHVPFLFKQWGDHDENGQRVGKGRAGRSLDGVTHDAFPEPRPCAV